MSELFLRWPNYSYHFIFPPAMCERSSFSILSQTWETVIIFYYTDSGAQMLILSANRYVFLIVNNVGHHLMCLSTALLPLSSKYISMCFDYLKDNLLCFCFGSYFILHCLEGSLYTTHIYPLFNIVNCLPLHSSSP